MANAMYGPHWVRLPLSNFVRKPIQERILESEEEVCFLYVTDVAERITRLGFESLSFH